MFAIAAVLAACLTVWYGAGRASARLGAPAITGIILGGVLVGPDGLNLLPPDMSERLVPLEQACLSVIALTAGMELAAEDLARTGRQVITLTLAIAAGSWATTAAATAAMLAVVGAGALGLEPGTAWAVVTLSGTMALARSPASAIAVIQEVQGSGPYCSMVMAITVLKDIFLFLLFAINMDVIAMSLTSGPSDAMSTVWLIVTPLLRVWVSAMLGVLGGAPLIWLLQQRGPLPGLPDWTLPHRVQRLLAARLGPPAALPAVAVACLTFFAAQAILVEPLVACVAAGLVARNSEALGAPQTGRDVIAALHAGVAAVMPGVNVAFFGLMGAHLRLGLLAGLAPFSLLVALARMAGVAAGAAAGSATAGVAPSLRPHLWQGMITQAGIALGMCQVIARTFPGWGPNVSALIAGTVLANLIVGPLLFKAAISSVGESGARAGGGSRAGKQRNSELRSLSEGGSPAHQIPVIHV